MLLASSNIIERQFGSEFVISVSNLFSGLGPEGQLNYLYFQILLFFLLALLSIGSTFSNQNNKLNTTRVFNADGLFSTFLFLFILVGRFPNAIYGYQNPDEGVWIACAKVFLEDPRLWVSMDTSTSGPIVLAPLILLKWLSLPIDFGSIKLASAITISASLVVVYYSLVTLFGKAIGRISILPAAVALSMTSYWDFITYNGEQMPMLLLGCSLWLLAKIYRSEEKKSSNYYFYLGFLLGLIPFAKLQAVPLALFLALTALILCIKRSYSLRFIILFLVSGIVPALIFIFCIFLGGGLSHFWNSYIAYNLFYAVSETPDTVTLYDKILLAWNMLFNSSDLTLLFKINILICAFCLLFIKFKKLKNDRKNFSVITFSLMYFIVSLFCIGQPYRTFTHYVLFAITPITLLVGSLLYNLSAYTLATNFRLKAQTILVAILVFASGLYVYERFNIRPGYMILAESYKNGYSYMANVVTAINEVSNKKDKIAIWGWSNTFYSDTDLIMGTRFADPVGIFTRTPFADYLLEVYMKDLTENKPTVFLDAINTNAARYADRELYGFHLFPPVKEFVEKNYKMVSEIDGYRIYVRL